MNARELGGYICQDGRKIKHGVLLRGGGLKGATDFDIYRLENEFHITKVFDFRTQMETVYLPDRAVPGADSVWLPAIDPETEKLGESTLPHDAYRDLQGFLIRNASNPKFQEVARNFYPEMIFNEYTQLQYAAFLQMLVKDETRSVYWHCSQGKDRTGLAAAFLLIALGADRQTVIEDYDISQEYYRSDVEEVFKKMDALGATADEKAVALTFIGANTEFFSIALNMIDKEFGSLQNYVRDALCLSEEDRKILCDKYLEV